MSAKVENYRSERGMILRLLKVGYPKPSTVRSLWSMLDKRNMAMSRDDLNIHIAYLTEQGYVTPTLAREISAMDDDATLSPGDVVMARLSAKGLQLLNGAIDDVEVAL